MENWTHLRALVDDVDPEVYRSLGPRSGDVSGFIVKDRDLGFRSHRCIGSFGIDNEKSYLQKGRPAYIHLPSKLNDLNVNLNHGFKESTLFHHHFGKSGYNGYKRIRKRHYLQWITESQYIQSPPDPKVGHFICFSEVISSLLTTTYRFDDHWTINATKLNGYIFLEKVKAISGVRPVRESTSWRGSGGRDEQRLGHLRRDFNWSRDSSRETRASSVQRPSRGRDFEPNPLLPLLSYHVEKFKDLITTSSRREVGGLLGRKAKRVFSVDEKWFDFFETDFGTSRILCLVDSEGNFPENGERVQVRLNKVLRNGHEREIFLRHKLLQWWGQCVVANIPRIVFGTRNVTSVRDPLSSVGESSGYVPIEATQQGILQDIETLETSSIPKKCQTYWKPRTCYVFLNRVLKFISDNVREGEGVGVFQFTLRRDDNTLHCMSSFLSQDEVLPEKFIRDNIRTFPVASKTLFNPYS